MVKFQIFANTALLQSTKAGSSSLIQYTYSWTKVFLGPSGRLQPAAPNRGPQWRDYIRAQIVSCGFPYETHQPEVGVDALVPLAGKNLKGKKEKRSSEHISKKKIKKCWTIPLERKQQGSGRGGGWIQQGTSRGQAENENEGRKSDTAPKCLK